MSETRILIVEDESIVAKDIEIRLTNLGYKICGVCTTGKDAIIKAQEMKPDLILMDIMLKDSMDGIAASEKIKEVLNVPIIFITAYGDIETLQRAKITEPFGFILKPFEERELHINIEIALYKHKVEKKIRENEEWLLATLTSIGDAVITTDTEKKVTFMNPIAEKLTGWTRQECNGKNLSEVFNIFSENNPSRFEDPVTSVLQDGISMNRGEDIILKNRFGKEIYINNSATPIRDYENRITGIVLIFHDITDKRKAAEALRKSEEKYKDLTDSLPQTIFESDQNGQLTYINNHAYLTFGFTNEEFNRGISFMEMLVEEDRKRAKENIWRIMNGEESPPNEYTVHKKDGTLCPILIYSKPIYDENNKVSGLRGIVIDISELRKTENALKESEVRYSLTLQGTNDGFWDWNIKTNEIIYSARWKNMLGFAEDEIENNIEEWFSRVHPDEVDILKEKLEAYLNGVINQFEYEYRILHKDNSYGWCLCRGNAIRDIDGIAYRMAGAQTDINEHKETEHMLEKLLHNVSHDSLTSLPNRSLFLDRLNHSINNTRRKKDFLFAVLFVDIDRFKIINDSLGHSFGNQLLIETSKKLQSCLRPEDTIARIGGDEFGILLDDITSVNDAISVANRIQKEFKSPFNLNNHDIFITSSIGIAISSTTLEQPEELLRDADLAMFKAKTLGRARHELFDSGMHTHAIEILQLETDLRRAIDRQEFTIYYQPIISLPTGKITGFEALIRWFHPEKGLIMNDKFIPVAEETGLIIPIGRWVLREACIQLNKWQEKFKTEKPLTMSVNISGKQFNHPNLIDQVTQILRETGTDASDLKLEITESTIMENAENARKMLRQLREMNIQLQIDDFGTGYSSLSYLHWFPVNTLKIDRSFVSRIGSDDENLEIVKTIVLLARNLKMNVIAEGIETEEQLQHLRDLKCDHGQGFYFSKPMHTDIIEEVMENDPKW
jgi:diguanylate cyclase (GGDEF)-like protein/PAS domain S-box-containing protein